MRATLSCRLAGPADLAQIVARQAWRESNYPDTELIRRWVQSCRFWVAELENRPGDQIVGQIVGWMSLEHTFFEEGFVSVMWVEDEFRRQGIGTALLLKAREICKTRRLWTSTNESNLPMRGLLEAMGWEFSGTIAT